MDVVRPAAVTSKKSKLARTVAKVLHIRALTGVAPVDGIQKVNSEQNVEDQNAAKSADIWPKSTSNNDEEELQESIAVEALLAKMFASISSIKASYAHLQHAQAPYDPDSIQSADQLVVSELKNLSELKQCYIKKQFDPSPETAMLLAEVQEVKSLSKTYMIMGKKLESQMRLKDSEIIYLREKLEETCKQNRSLEKRFNQSGQLSMLDNFYHSGLSPSHFMTALRSTIKSVRSFVRLMIDEMRLAKWDLDAAAVSIVSKVIYWTPDDKCFAFESYVCRQMFEAFHLPNFSFSTKSLPDKKSWPQFFFKRFTELNSVKAKEYLEAKPESTFAKFCRAKYLQLVHPQMEASFFGDLSQRNLLNSGQLPDTMYFSTFAEMARRIWLLHCLAFSFKPEVSIFQIQKGSRFSEVYMECVAEEALISSENAPEADPPVAFTVFPGFRVGKTIIQCKVYLSQFHKVHL